MTDASISEMTFTMLSLLFLLLGVVLIVSILMSTINPYQQITFANTEKLRAAIEQACSGRDTTINIDLPQNTPKFTGVFTVMPIWIITASGDPNYVLYYESFPIGEGTGWEIYQTMQNRLVTYLPDGYGGGDKNYEDVQKYAEEVIKKARAKNAGFIEGVIISNIVLDDKYDSSFYLGEGRAAGEGIGGGGSFGGAGASGTWEQQKENLNKLGKWKYVDEKTNGPSVGDNVFKFNNYAGLSTFEKSAIKYEACGENSLCLKTRNGVYRFPLRGCRDIKAVHMIYKALGDTDAMDLHVKEIFGLTVAGELKGFLERAGWFKVLQKRLGKILLVGKVWVIGDLVTNMVQRHIAFKVSDFSATSPCSIKNAEIKKVPCRTAQPAIPGYVDEKFEVCESFMEYPMYQYTQDGKLAKLGKKHYACIESMGPGIDTVPEIAFKPEDQCIQVEVKKFISDYCWTPNPYKDTNDGFFETLLQGDIIKESYLWFFDPPIHSHTAYIEPSPDYPQEVAVLKPTHIALKAGEGLFSELGRKWWWGWP
jgi:uncharacterized membrane protein YgcG